MWEGKILSILALGSSPYFLLDLTGRSTNSKIGIVLGSAGGVIGLLIIGVAFLFCKGRRKGYRPEIFVDVSGLSFYLYIKLGGLLSFDLDLFYAYLNGLTVLGVFIFSLSVSTVSFLNFWFFCI